RDAALGGDQGALGELVARLGLDGEDVDFLWCAVGASVDPIALAERRAIVPDAERGLDLASYAALTGAPPEVAARLALVFSAGHPLIRRGVLDLDAGAVPAANRYRASAAALAWLATGAGPARARLAPPADARYSPAQHAALRRIDAALAD